MPSVSAEDLQPGQMLVGRFRLVRAIGRGAMGTVWLAHDTCLDDEPVACKVLSGPLAHDRRAIAYLKREVLLTRRLRHPHIVGVYTFWESDGIYFITMEFVDGRNLSEALTERDYPFTLAETLPWVIQLCEALDYAHEQGILHRDIKPANFLLDGDGTAKLADFGIARTLHDLQYRTSGGVTCGTVMFMSPEQLMGERVDRRSDLYSMAASVYELLAGSPPFFSGSIVAQIQSKPVPEIEHLPDAVNDVLLRALSKIPSERQPTCGEFAADLASAVDRAGAEAAQATFVGPRRAVAMHDTTVKLLAGEAELFPDRLGALLLDAGSISPEQLAHALDEQKQTGERIGEVLRRLGHIDEIAMALALERQLRIPFVALEKEHFDPQVTGVVDRGFALASRCIPVRRIGDRILVVMADPLDFDTLNTFEMHFGVPVTPRIATESDILQTISRLWGSGEETSPTTID